MRSIVIEFSDGPEILSTSISGTDGEIIDYYTKDGGAINIGNADKDLIRQVKIIRLYDHQGNLTSKYRKISPCNKE